MRARLKPLLRAALALATLGCAAGLFAGCASPRDALGPTESPCYLAIPIGRAVAGHAATFAGVRYLTVSTLEQAINHHHPLLANAVHVPRGQRQAECVVAFHGRFTDRLDRHASGPASGAYLIVIVGLKYDKELAALVVSRLPLRLTRFGPTTH